MGFEKELMLLFQVVIGLLLGGGIGLERELGNKPAGLRTHMLVCAASTLFVALGTTITEHFVKTFNDQVINADPTRIIHAVAIGVSFIGAGTIVQMERKEKVKFLTTAASILYTAGIGVAVGISQYILAVGVTLLGVGVNQFVGKFEARVLKRKPEE